MYNYGSGTTLYGCLVNKLVHILNGNIKYNYEILHWNSGKAFLENKITEIESIITQYKPTILGISESNLREETNLTEVSIEGYDLITTQALNNVGIKMSRLVVYIKKEVNYERRNDLENGRDAAI